MKKFSIIIYILICSIFDFGQNDLQTSPNWQEFSPKGEEFSVNVPQKMVEHINILKNSEGKEIFTNGTYRTYFNGIYFYIFSEMVNPQSIKMFPTILDSLKSFINENANAPELTSISNLRAIKYEFKDSEDFFHTILFLKTTKRFYTFHTISEQKIAAEIENFVKTIKFQEISNQPKEQTFEEQIKSIETAPNNNNNLNILQKLSDGEGTRSIFENGVGGNQSSPAQVSQSQPSSATPLKITSKQSPPYTDLARNYEITGTVLLRVTFLSSGSIGTISAVKKLPFGLTKNAIEAANQVTFEPASKNGIKYSVVKTLQFVFTLY
ncbi:MAG: energy transducer TonB [Pyrinomonadaceae bacterium]|nr:energy transducer TonB [Pyrinomonadaceae bacterium]